MRVESGDAHGSPMLSAAEFRSPPTKLTGFTGPGDTLRSIVEVVQGDRGERSMVVRALLEEITRGLTPKDYLGEILAIRNTVAERVRYINDPQHVELLKDPERLASEIFAKGIASGDCDDMAALIAALGLAAGRGARIAGVGFGPPGSLSHVFALIQEPKTSAWIVCDPVAGTDERKMLRTATTWEIWSLDEPPNAGPMEKR